MQSISCWKDLQYLHNHDAHKTKFHSLPELHFDKANMELGLRIQNHQADSQPSSLFVVNKLEITEYYWNANNARDSDVTIQNQV